MYKKNGFNNKSKVKVNYRRQKLHIITLRMINSTNRTELSFKSLTHNKINYSTSRITSDDSPKLKPNTYAKNICKLSLLF